MPLYECVFIARQDISASQMEGLVKQFSDIVEQNEGRIAKSEMWGLRNLAYRIKKNRKGHYALLNIEAPAAVVHEMERNMRINEDVLRYLTVRVEELEEGPSAVLQSRHSRDDRGGRGGRGGGRGGDRGGDRGDRGDRGGDRDSRRGGSDSGGHREERQAASSRDSSEKETKS
jgi:small subunit ribosomal protein S6